MQHRAIYVSYEPSLPNHDFFLSAGQTVLRVFELLSLFPVLMSRNGFECGQLRHLNDRFLPDSKIYLPVARNSLVLGSEALVEVLLIFIGGFIFPIGAFEYPLRCLLNLEIDTSDACKII